MGLVSSALAARNDESTTASPAQLQAYKSIVGAMLYCATHTRPDIAYPVGLLCRCMACPTADLAQAAQHVLRYLERHDNLGLTYASSPAGLSGSSAADWAPEQSTLGWCFKYTTAVVSWGSKKQKTIALSRSDATIMSASEASKEAVYLESLLSELDATDDAPIKVDVSDVEVSSTSSAPPPSNTDASKHIQRRHLWMHELQENSARLPVRQQHRQPGQLPHRAPLHARLHVHAQPRHYVGSRAPSGH